MADKVTLTLAYPLSAKQAERVLAEDIKDYQVGDRITVRRDYAVSVINAGYAAGVDPSDAEAVQAALDGDQPDPEVDSPEGEVTKVEESVTPPAKKVTKK